MGYRPNVSDAAVAAKTGRPWREWFRVLDGWGAASKTHPEIARYLAEARGVPPWWSQMITVHYERARGMRVVGERATGAFEASVQRTIPAHAASARAAWLDDSARAAWASPPSLARALGRAAATLRESRTAQGVVLRMDLGGTTGGRLEVQLTPKGASTVVRVTHAGLPTAAARDKAKAGWVGALDTLKRVVDASPEATPTVWTARPRRAR